MRGETLGSSPRGMPGKVSQTRMEPGGGMRASRTVWDITDAVSRIED